MILAGLLWLFAASGMPNNKPLGIYPEEKAPSKEEARKERRKLKKKLGA
jgi:hypothetical protein